MSAPQSRRCFRSPAFWLGMLALFACLVSSAAAYTTIKLRANVSLGAKGDPIGIGQARALPSPFKATRPAAARVVKAAAGDRAPGSRPTAPEEKRGPEPPSPKGDGTKSVGEPASNGPGSPHVGQAVEPSPEPSTHPSESRIYWGAWMDGDVYGGGLGDAPWSGATWDRFEASAGKSPSIVHFGQPAPWNQSFAAAPLEAASKRGAIPLMDMSGDGAPLSAIAAGSYDSQLKAWAEAVRSYAKPFFFRWQWEMNGIWFPWGAEAAADPAAYVAAWRHFHDVAEAQGATNITWVWCPNALFPGSTPLASLYPGDAYVDWTCIDGYNFGRNPIRSGAWTSFLDIFAPTYAALRTLAPSKPIMVGETGSTEIGGSKPTWITDALGSTIPHSFPGIEAIIWFNWNIPDGSGQWDWPIESSSASREAFAEAISSPYYASNAFGNLPPLTRIQPLP